MRSVLAPRHAQTRGNRRPRPQSLVVKHRVHSTLRRKEQPSVRRARPPVGWHSITLQLPQSTTVWAWLYTVVICKHPGHFTSMKKLFGDWIIRFSLCLVFSSFLSGLRRSISMAAVRGGGAVHVKRMVEPTV